jgi:hypothetical protein
MSLGLRVPPRFKSALLSAYKLSPKLKGDHPTWPTRFHSTNASPEQGEAFVYRGPFASTYRNLKIFSLSSLALSSAFTPLIFVMESSLSFAPRLALASVTLLTGGLSTAMIAWCGRPYVTLLRNLNPAENGGLHGLEMTTTTMFLHPLLTRVYDINFLVDTKRPFAKWELAQTTTVPASKVNNREETVAETFDRHGQIIGRWIVTWDGQGNGTCRKVGKVARLVRILNQCSKNLMLIHLQGTLISIQNYYHINCLEQTKGIIIPTLASPTTSPLLLAVSRLEHGHLFNE